ncbi:MAG TPA: hypothetical protein DD621_01875 [Clostridiales bacterium]|nr:hypothetical protein [Clostridiales bacterium]
MEVKNINTVDEYPDNYDFLSKDTQNKIVEYMNNYQEDANNNYEKHITALDDKSRSMYLDLYNHVVDILIGSKNAYSIVGIKLEYNWNHDSKWLLATKADYQANNGLSDDCNCQMSQEEYTAWPYPKVNK